MATSPSDQNNRNVLAWLDRLQDSVRTAGRSAGPAAFNLESRGEEGEEESELESEDDHGNAAGDGERTERGSVGTAGTVKVEEEEDKLHILPDDAAPLGLIAKLSLDSSSGSRRKGAAAAAAASSKGDETDDDNVVSTVVCAALGERRGLVRSRAVARVCECQGRADF